MHLILTFVVIFCVKDVVAYRTTISFPTWREQPKALDYTSTSIGMECKTFIKIVTTTPVQIRYTCRNRKCRTKADCLKRYICTGQTLKNVTRYKQVNVCCPGYITENERCIRDCDGHTYGQNCSLPCNCPQNAHKSCDTGFGTCYCLPGWMGDKCDQKCPNGTFGDDCQHQCACANGASCDHVTGKCTCTKPGWRGKYCDKACPKGRYGINCSKRCVCGASKRCHPETGECICPPGLKGQRCKDVCRDGKFGYNCSSACVCNQDNTSACDPVTGDCYCKPGWSGITCNQICPHGQFGENCDSQCDCNSTDACDPFTGRCIHRCVCNAEGTSNCDSDHEPCSCDTHALQETCSGGVCSCNSSAKYCVPKTSLCRCKEGWTGFQCNLRVQATVSENLDIEAQQEKQTFAIIAISCVSGIVLAVGLVFVVIFCKARLKRNKASGTEDDNDVILEGPVKETKLYYDSVPVNGIVNQGGASLSGSTTELIAAQSEIDTEDIMAPHVYQVLEKTGTSFDSLHRKKQNRIQKGENRKSTGSEVTVSSNFYHVLNPYTTIAEVNGAESGKNEFGNAYPAVLSARDLQDESIYKDIDDFDSMSDSSFDSVSEFDMNTFIRKDVDTSKGIDHEYATVQKENENRGPDILNRFDFSEDDAVPDQVADQNDKDQRSVFIPLDENICNTTLLPVENIINTDSAFESDKLPVENDVSSPSDDVLLCNGTVAEPCIINLEATTTNSSDSGVSTMSHAKTDNSPTPENVEISKVTDDIVADDIVADDKVADGKVAQGLDRRVSTISDQFKVINDLLQQAIDENKSRKKPETMDEEEAEAFINGNNGLATETVKDSKAQNGNGNDDPFDFDVFNFNFDDHDHFS